MQRFLCVVLLCAAVTTSHMVPSAELPREPYTWKNVQIVGGGFVDGIIFHPKEKGLRYARTDIWRRVPLE